MKGINYQQINYTMTTHLMIHTFPHPKLYNFVQMYYSVKVTRQADYQILIFHKI